MSDKSLAHFCNYHFKWFYRDLVQQRDDFAHKMVSATLQQQKYSTENENIPSLHSNLSAGNPASVSISGKPITPESNHIALEVSELKAQIRKLKHQL